MVAVGGCEGRIDGPPGGTPRDGASPEDESNPDRDAGPTGDAPIPPPPPDAPPAPYCTAHPGTRLRLVLIADNLEHPVYVTAPTGDGRLFILEQPGRIRIVKDGRLLAAPYLDIESRVLSTGDEQGLLGLAFHPRFAQNGRFFVFYTQPGGDLAIAEYGADPAADTARTAEERIMTIDRATADNHNGGSLQFGTDGYLYISAGDGGGAEDTYHNGQNKNSQLAKILRIDIDKGSPYGIPSDNPFASGGGAREAFVWGLRNPYRFSIDHTSGNLFIGDVGQGGYEEINVVPYQTNGQNFGWPIYEGPTCLDPEDGDPPSSCPPPERYQAPTYAYDRRRPDTGCSVIGGYVYRGTCMPDFVGTYFFGDYCTGDIYSFVYSGGPAQVTDRTNEIDPNNDLYGDLSGFGVDGYGELYLTDLGNRGPGRVYRIETE